MISLLWVGLAALLISPEAPAQLPYGLPAGAVVIESQTVPSQWRANRAIIQSSYWVDYLFSKKPTAPRYWKYEIDYRGRGGTLDQYEIRYNPQLERFEGKVDSKQ
jgi:hypothetical protein